MAILLRHTILGLTLFFALSACGFRMHRLDPELDRRGSECRLRTQRRPNGYLAPFADHTLGSKVDVRPRHRYGPLNQVALDGKPISAPSFVLVDDGSRIAIAHIDRVVLHAGNGVQSMATRWWSALRPKGLVHGTALLGTDGHDLPGPVPQWWTDDHGIQVSTLVNSERWLMLIQSMPAQGGDGFIVVSASTSGVSSLDWQAKTRGQATGAIGYDGRTMVATKHGDLTIYASEGTGDGTAPVLVSRELDRPFYAVSAVNDGFAVLESRHPPNGGSDYRWYSLYVVGASVETGWETEVHQFDKLAQRKWSVTVPLAVTQPAVDGSGRLWLAGNGLAAVAEGRVEWLRTGTTRHRATAFADGTLAVTYGDSLELLEASGRSRQVLRVTGEHPIVTPPAISRDGRLWVATQDGQVWVAG